MVETRPSAGVVRLKLENSADMILWLVSLDWSSLKWIFQLLDIMFDMVQGLNRF